MNTARQRLSHGLNPLCTFKGGLKAGFRKRRSRKRSRKKWKRSDSADSESVALMTPLTTPILYFH